MFLAEEKFWKSSGLAKYFAGVSPSRVRKYRELGSFVRLWALTFRKKAGRLVKTTGAHFMGGCQVMEVIYSHRNLLWQRMLVRFISIYLLPMLLLTNKTPPLPANWTIILQCQFGWMAPPAQCGEPRLLFIRPLLFVHGLHSPPEQHPTPGIPLASDGKLELPRRHGAPRITK